MSTSAPGQSFQDGRGFREQVLVAPNRANRLQEKVDEQLKLDEEIRKKEEELRRTEEEIRRIEELQMNHNLLSQELTSQGLVQQEMMSQGFMTQDLMSSGLVMGQPNGQSQVTMSLVEQIYQNYESPAIQIESNGYVLDENEAAIKIQAAYRGYHIRKTLSRDASPSPSPTSPRNQYVQDTFFNQESNASLDDGFFQIEQQELKQQTEVKKEKELQGIQLTETHKETESQNDKAEVKQIDNQENKVIEGPKAETKQEYKQAEPKLESPKQEEPRQQEVKQQEQPKQDEPKKQERQKPNEIVRFQILPGDITFRTQTSVDIATPPFVGDEQFTFEQPQEVVNQEKVEVANEIIEVISSSRKSSKDDVKDEQEVIIDKVQQEKEDDKEQEADEEQEEAVLSSEGKEHDEKDFRRRNKKSKKQRQREKRREEAEKQAAAAASQKDHVKSVQEPKVDVKPKDEGPKVIDVIIKESENKIEEIKSEEAKTEIKTEETRIQIPDFEVPKAEVSNESQIKEAQEKSNDKTDISNEGITTNKNVELEITKILNEAIKEQTQQGQITTDPSVILLDLKEQILKDEQQQELQHQIQQQEVKREQELQKPIECQDADTLITLQTNEGLIQLQVDQPTQLQAAQAAQAVSQLQSNAFQSTESPIKLQENFHLQMQETEVQNKVKEPQEFQAAPSQAPESQETLASEIHTPQTLGTLASQASESLTPQIPETQVQQALDFQAPQVPVSQAPVFQVSEFQAPQATGSKQETQVLTSDPKSNLQLDLESPFICDVISPNIIQSPSSPDDGQGDDADAEADEPVTGLFTTMPVRASSPNPFGRKKRKGKKGSKR